MNNNQIIGAIILGLCFTTLFSLTGSVMGFLSALVIWSVGVVFACLILLGLILVTDDE